MHRKHFIMIAEAIKVIVDDLESDNEFYRKELETIYKITNSLVSVFCTFNQSFDREKFYKACGLVSFDL